MRIVTKLGAGNMQMEILSVTPTSFCGREDPPSLRRAFYIVSVKLEYHVIPLR